MTIEDREVGDVVILRLKGAMTLGESDEELKWMIRNLLENGKRKFLLGMEGVPYVDSAGLYDILRSFNEVEREGGNLKLFFVSKSIENLMAITGLSKIVDIFENEAEAIKSFD